MCRSVTCGTCGKTTWAGCGRHVEEVFRGVPAARRCPGHAAEASANAHAATDTAAAPSGAGRFLTRLLGLR